MGGPTTAEEMRAKLIELYQAMYKLTEPECSCSCKIPRSCCSPEYCEMTISYAKDRWGVELVKTDHARLPLMGDEGCVAAPHLRPMCTLHTCAINSLGFKPDDPEWNDKYFDLRGQIDALEMNLSYELRRGTSPAAS